MGFKDSCTWCLAKAAPSLFVQIPGREGIPIPPDQHVSAGMAIGAATFFIVHITGIDIPQAVVHRDGAGQGQGRGGGARRLQHFEIGVKGGKMQRHVWAQMFHQPLG